MSTREEGSGGPRAPSRLPLFYFGFAHLCLAAALLALGLLPRSFAGFFYHPRMLAAVHLVTLGWISSHILGALYMIAPMALRTRLAATRADTVAFWIWVIGVVGMVAHFWIAETSGMVWAAFLVLATLILVGARLVAALRSSPIGGGIKLHYGLAFANVAGAAVLGILLGIHRLRPFLGIEPLQGLYAHAHLAALGWATMIVYASAYRLLPMMLPSAPPPPASTWPSALLLEAGVVGLVASFLLGRGSIGLFAAIAAASVAWFLGVAVWLLRHRRRPGTGLPRLDFTRLHALSALGYLGVTAVLGLVLAIAPRSTDSLRLAKVYGVCGLLGFFGTMILGVAGRHVPVLIWTRRMHADGPPAVSPYRLRSPVIAAVELACWSLGVPFLAFALWREAAAPLSVAAWMLLVAVVASAANQIGALYSAPRTALAPEGAE